MAIASPTCPCPACGFLVFSLPYGSTRSCPVCHWVDDLMQLSHPDFAVGQNSGVSLRQAQRAELAIHPITVKEAAGFTRDPAWRPLFPAEYPRTGDTTLASPVCYLTVPAPDTFEPYWLIPRGNDSSDD